MVLLASGIVGVVNLAGCHVFWPSRSTRLMVEDIEDMAERMAQSLQASEQVAKRSPESPPWRVTIEKVENLTSDLITESERWAVMAKIAGSLPIQSLWDDRNIRLIIPAQKSRVIRQQTGMEDYESPYASQRDPTHLLTARFLSVTRAQATRRTELYYCQFEVLEIGTGQLIWQDKVEFKRVARGHVLD